MARRRLEADYLVIGAGAAGMAFTDTLVTERDAEVVMVDRRHAPGGHWNDVYPFCRLHQPSRYYGVNSMALGSDAIAEDGPEPGMYERATGPQVCAYYERVMEKKLSSSGRVRFFPQCEYVGEHQFVSRLSGDTFEVAVRDRLVDGSYLSPEVPAASPPPFEIDPGVSCAPVNALAHVEERPERYVIIGGGKTGIDACLHLLENGVDPALITWIKPREAWLFNRLYFQPGELVGTFMEGLARQLECAARATSADDLFDRLEEAEQLRRVDRSVRPTMHRSATISDRELELLRRIEDVVRLGHVRRIRPGEIVLDEGSVPTSPNVLHVHCAAEGLRGASAVPIFGPDRITLQPIRHGLIPFNAALVAFVEAHRDDDAEKNRLCPPNPFPSTALDWARATLIGTQADYLWSKEADISGWLEGARLNPTRGLRERRDEPAVQKAWQRFAAHARAGVARLAELTRS